MHHLNLTKQLFWIIAGILTAGLLLITLYLFQQTKELTEERALGRAKSLHDYFVSMQNVYHRQFVASGIDLNDSTIGFLPTHAALLIDCIYRNRSSEGGSVRSIPLHAESSSLKTDPYERDAIRFFSGRPDVPERHHTVLRDGKPYLFYATPIRAEKMCLQCHGTQESETGYNVVSRGFKEGDIIGIASIRVPKEELNEQSMSMFWKEVAVGWGTVLFLLGVIYYALHELTRRNVLTQAKLTEEVSRQMTHILRLSQYDPLTELPNRHLLMERLEEAVSASFNSRRYGVLFFINLDNFKGINDLKGHHVGDEILRQMGYRILSDIRHSDTAARLGGDEFVVLIENIATDEQDAAKAARTSALKIIESIKEPIVIENAPFYLTASIGIVLYQGNKVSANELLSHAETALNEAKDSGRNTFCFYDESIQKTMASQAKMVQELRAAIHTDALYPVYQELVDDQKQTVGIEMLMRWEHPEIGFVPPSEFIPLAEESGMIAPLGKWILEKAAAQIAQWSGDPVRSRWRISINISPRQFEQSDFVPLLQRTVDAARIDPSKLRLELTEGLLIRGAEQAMAKINELKRIGFSLSIDDFGTGYSSLSYLKHLPIDELKIDQSFIKALPESPSDQAIVRTMIALADAFDLEVIAEGVETPEQFEMLKKMGCRLFQGYLFGHPKRAAGPLD